MTRIDVDISDYRGFALNHVIAQDAVTMQNYDSKMASTKNKIEDNLNKYHGMSTMQDKVQQLKSEWQEYNSLVTKMVAASRGNDTAKAMAQTAIYTFWGICLVIMLIAGVVGMKMSNYIINMLKKMTNKAMLWIQ